MHHEKTGNCKHRIGNQCTRCHYDNVKKRAVIWIQQSTRSTVSDVEHCGCSPPLVRLHTENYSAEIGSPNVKIPLALQIHNNKNCIHVADKIEPKRNT